MTDRFYAISGENLRAVTTEAIETVASRYRPHTNVEPLSASVLAEQVWEEMHDKLVYWMAGWVDWEMGEDDE